jgi:hypothetical protein
MAPAESPGAAQQMTHLAESTGYTRMVCLRILAPWLVAARAMVAVAVLLVLH